MRKTLIACVALALAIPAAMTRAATEKELVGKGRYLIRISGCNDCHTPGYSTNGGSTPEKLWLTGDQIGWQGPWGTTYGSNLRLLVASMDSQAWIKYARTTQTRPPMPWWSLRDMSDDDLVAIWHYMRSLKPVGEAARRLCLRGNQRLSRWCVFPPEPAPETDPRGPKNRP